MSTDRSALLSGDHGGSYGTVSPNAPDDNEPSGNGSSTATASEQIKKTVVTTPLDMSQIFILVLARISEPITFTILFPFVQQMIVDTGEVSVEEVGYAVGLIEASFSVTQFFSLMFWARAADQWGRKPVLILSLLGACMASSLFGFSTHIWQMYASRFIAGVFGGNAMIIRTLFSENCDLSNQALAFSYFAFAANIGGILGPTLGGFLSDPVHQWPRVFENSHLFQAYPYALPGLVAGGYCAVTLGLCLVYLKETRPDECDTPMPVKEILTPRMIKMLVIFGWTVTVIFSLNALFPLYLFTPITIGGQGRTPPQIAQLGMTSACFQGFWLLVVMPRLDRWLGTRKLFTLIAALMPLQMLNPILANVFARRSSPWGSFFAIGVYVTLGQFVNMSYTSVQLLLNTCAPPRALASVNGIAVALSGVVKSVFPASLNAIFALSVSDQILHGYLAWVILMLMAAGVLIASLFTPVDTPAVGAKQERERIDTAEAEAVSG